MEFVNLKCHLISQSVRPIGPNLTNLSREKYPKNGLPSRCKWKKHEQLKTAMALKCQKRQEKDADGDDRLD